MVRLINLLFFSRLIFSPYSAIGKAWSAPAPDEESTALVNTDDMFV